MKITAAIIIAMFICSCSESSTTLNSQDYDDRTERVDVLKKEIVSASDFADAEFSLFNVNGFSDGNTFLPGASSWNYEFAVKVDTSDLDLWIEGMTLVDSSSYNLSWTLDVTGKRTAAWSTTGKPEIYRRGGEDVVVIVYRVDGIVFKEISNL